MASWRNYYRRRYKRYYKNKYRNSYGKRSYGQFKAAKQQADQASQVLNIPTQFSCFSKVETLTSGARASEEHETGTFALNIYDLLRKSEFYQSYASMYDEFKIDNVKVKLIPTKYNVTVGDGESGYQSFTVYTAWDRTGLNANQLYLSVNNSDADGMIGSNSNSNSGLYCTVGSDITTYSSAESRQISIGQNSTIVRWLKPKTIQEKSQWISTSQLKAWSYYYNEVKGCYQQIPISSRYSKDGQNDLDIISALSLNYSSLAFALNDVSPAVSNNPCFIEEDPTINFKPTLLVGIYPVENNQDRPRTVSFNIEAEVACSFRGLRKSKVVSSSSNPTPTPSVNVQPLVRTIQAFDEPLEITTKPTGVDGYFPITVGTNIRFNKAVVTENDTSYTLQKFTPQNQPPYYQVAPATITTPASDIIFDVSVKGTGVPSVDAVQFGGSTGFIDDFSSFTQVSQPVTLDITPGSCVVILTKNSQTANTTVNYIYSKMGDPTADPPIPNGDNIQMTIEVPDNENIIKYYHRLVADAGTNFTSIPDGIRLINTSEENKLYFSLFDQDADNKEGDISGNYSNSVIIFETSDMDVEPDESINTKKEFKTTK